MYRFSIASNKPRYGISNLELADGCFGFPLCDMNGAQVEAIRNDLIHQLARVVLYSVEMPVTETERYIRFFRNVHLIQAENVLLTDSAIVNATDSDIQSIIRMGEAFSIRILFRPGHAFSLERYAALRSEWTGLYYDPMEFVKLHINPYRDVIYKNKCKDDIIFLRVCDMVFDTLETVLPEHGNAQIKECAATLLTRHYRGYFSFSPYGTQCVQDVIHAFCNSLTHM